MKRKSMKRKYYDVTVAFNQTLPDGTYKKHYGQYKKVKYKFVNGKLKLWLRPYNGDTFTLEYENVGYVSVKGYIA